MGSGIVFVIIIGLWAVVLVPMWLRNHDAAVESKSVDRFSTAMRTLSRRSPSRSRSGPRDVLVPATRSAAVISGGRAPSATARREQAARAARMRRRRTATLALLGFLAVVAVAAVVGAAPLWLPALVLVVAGGYLWNLRVQAQREARAARRRKRHARPDRVPVVPNVPQAPIWPVTAERRAPVGADVVAAAAVADVIDESWAPTPVVLPTYVTAPPATSVPRVIDLTHPGSWSAAHMLDAVAAAGAPDPDEIFDGRAVSEPVGAPAARGGDEFFDQYSAGDVEAEQTAVAETAAPRPFLDDDVFDQYDEDDRLLALLERRASGG